MARRHHHSCAVTANYAPLWRRTHNAAIGCCGNALKDEGHTGRDEIKHDEHGERTTSARAPAAGAGAGRRLGGACAPALAAHPPTPPSPHGPLLPAPETARAHTLQLLYAPPPRLLRGCMPGTTLGRPRRRENERRPHPAARRCSTHATLRARQHHLRCTAFLLPVAYLFGVNVGSFVGSGMVTISTSGGTTWAGRISALPPRHPWWDAHFLR